MNTCILAFLLSAVAATAAEFHVAPTGADALIKARDEARKVSGPNTIVLAPGGYFNHGTMVLDDRDTGLTIKGAQFRRASVRVPRRELVFGNARGDSGQPGCPWCVAD